MPHLARYALFAMSLCSLVPIRTNACTAIVVGKKASATGHVLIGHNEDVSNAFMRHAMLPRQDGKASAFWSEAKLRDGGDKVAACFYNEHGVFVVSNNGGVMREWREVLASRRGRVLHAQRRRARLRPARKDDRAG